MPAESRSVKNDRRKKDEKIISVSVTAWTLLAIIFALICGILAYASESDIKKSLVTPLFGFLAGLFGQYAWEYWKSARAGLKTDSLIEDSRDSVIEAVEQSIKANAGNLREIKSALDKLTPPEGYFWFSQSLDAYKYLEDHVRYAKKVTMIQYVCDHSYRLLSNLCKLGKGEIEIDLFIQNAAIPREQGSTVQANKTKDRELYIKDTLYKQTPPPKRLDIISYCVPASMSAIVIDDQFLCVGWYIYGPPDDNPVALGWGDKIMIRGHDQPAIVITGGAQGFQELKAAICSHAALLRASTTSEALKDKYPRSTPPSRNQI